MFHWYGSYVGKCGYYAKYFADKGYDFVGFDFRGFGKTKGQRGHIDSWEQHMKDCWTYYDIIRSNYDTSIPIVGCGYSLGGGTVFSMAIERPEAFKCIIQLAPFTGFAFGNHPALYLSKAIYKFYPRLAVAPLVIDPSLHLKEYFEDPLQITSPNTAGSVISWHNIEKFIKSNIDKLTVNMHITTGDWENVISRSNLYKIIKEAPAEVKELYEFAGVDHYILNNGIYLEDVVDCQLTFLQKNLG